MLFVIASIASREHAVKLTLMVYTLACAHIFGEKETHCIYLIYDKIYFELTI